MKSAGWITVFFGILILIGGVIGRIQADSAASLVMGISFGVLLILASISMFQEHLVGTYLGILLILLLDAFFTFRWLLTFKFFPPGIFSIISTVVLVIVTILVRRHFANQQKKK